MKSQKAEKLRKTIEKAIDNAKADKEKVHYRKGSKEERCGECEYVIDWTHPHKCKLVQGEIDPKWVCDLFEKEGETPEEEEKEDEFDED